jgi:hypothetical protein
VVISLRIHRFWILITLLDLDFLDLDFLDLDFLDFWMLLIR